MAKILTEKARIQLLVWLLTGCAMVFLMVIIGGITRLTGSGLSIVEWDLIMGAIPPLNKESWMIAFEKYKQFPQYQKMNAHMDLGGFKQIFFWEYLHRLWGRLIGIVFIVPFFVFLLQKKLNKKWIKKLMIAFILGALQGIVGWIMVKSGLVDIPWVSPYRLTLHLLLALLVYAYVFWLALQLIYLKKEMTETAGALKSFSFWITVLIGFQIMFGGFMAGVKAAPFYPTWPDMNGAAIPQTLFAIIPFWKNFFENPATIQFVHRNLAYLIVFAAIYFWYKIKNSATNSKSKKGADVFLFLVFTQVLLGILTLLFSVGKVPVFWGVAHQAVAVLLLTAVVYLTFIFSRASSHSNLQ